MATQLQQIGSMALTDLVLPKDALDNIIEENEIEEKLSAYATKAEVEEQVYEVESALSDYVPLSSYDSLVARVDALEQAVQQLQLSNNTTPAIDDITQLEEQQTELPQEVPPLSDSPAFAASKKKKKA